MSSTKELTQLGRYKVLSILGKGGAGIVYKAVDPVLGREVALKVGRLPAVEEEKNLKQYLAQSLQEARLAAKFIHPNIAITYDAGFENDRFFMALEHIDGKALSSYAQQETLLPTIKVMEYLYNICYALDYIHDKNYVHLDVKPANIMLNSSGDVKLMDFGISRLLKDKPETNDKITGSVFYMSPEQTDTSKKLDHRSDIFSLGVVLYELLTGLKPFVGDTPYQVIYQIVYEEPEPVKKVNPEIPDELSLIVKKALAKNPDERFQSTKEFAEALLPAIKGTDSAVLNSHDMKKISNLKKLNFFKHFQESDLEQVLKLASWRFHGAQTDIIHDKKSDRTIYIIIVGSASVHIGKEVKPMNPGDCFGETSVLYAIPSNAKMLAETDCVVMSINANVLNQADSSIQVKFLKEFYMNKTMQLVQANLKLIQKGGLKELG